MKDKKKSKGERLGWQHISEVKPIKLTLELIKGVMVEIKDQKDKKLFIE